jgi:hypothetical protein
VNKEDEGVSKRVVQQVTEEHFTLLNMKIKVLPFIRLEFGETERITNKESRN